MDLKKLLQAVTCAIAVLDGTAGGYSPAEKEAAKQTLFEVLPVLRKTAADTMSNVS